MGALSVYPSGTFLSSEKLEKRHQVSGGVEQEGHELGNATELDRNLFVHVYQAIPGTIRESRCTGAALVTRSRSPPILTSQ